MRKVPRVSEAVGYSGRLQHNELFSYVADLKGASEVPPTDSKGTGKVNATSDAASKKRTWTITYSGLTVAELGMRCRCRSAGRQPPSIDPGDQILEAGRRHLVMRRVDRREEPLERAGAQGGAPAAELVVEVSADHITDRHFRHGARILRWRWSGWPTRRTERRAGGGLHPGRASSVAIASQPDAGMDALRTRRLRCDGLSWDQGVLERGCRYP